MSEQEKDLCAVLADLNKKLDKIKATLEEVRDLLDCPDEHNGNGLYHYPDSHSSR